MRDEIIEAVWQAKESIASHAPGDFKKLAEYIKKETAEIERKGPTINLREKNIANIRSFPSALG